MHFNCQKIFEAGSQIADWNSRSAIRIMIGNYRSTIWKVADYGSLIGNKKRIVHNTEHLGLKKSLGWPITGR